MYESSVTTSTDSIENTSHNSVVKGSPPPIPHKLSLAYSQKHSKQSQQLVKCIQDMRCAICQNNISLNHTQSFQCTNKHFFHVHCIASWRVHHKNLTQETSPSLLKVTTCPACKVELFDFKEYPWQKHIEVIIGPLSRLEQPRLSNLKKYLEIFQSSYTDLSSDKRNKIIHLMKDKIQTAIDSFEQLQKELENAKIRNSSTATLATSTDLFKNLSITMKSVNSLSSKTLNMKHETVITAMEQLSIFSELLKTMITKDESHISTPVTQLFANLSLIIKLNVFLLEKIDNKLQNTPLSSEISPVITTILLLTNIIKTIAAYSFPATSFTFMSLPKELKVDTAH